jgi:hypothetical protein
LFGAFTIKVNPVGFPAKEVDNHASEKIDLNGIDVVFDNVYGEKDVIEFNIGLIIESVRMTRDVSKLSMIEWSPNENSR